MTILIFLFLHIISNTYGCAPTTPVATSTVSPNVTTTAVTTTVASNISTTTVVTTTVNNCCTWPFPGSGVNTPVPLQSDWNQCDQSVSFSCALSNSTGSVGVAVNYDTITTALTADQVVGESMSEILNITINCNTTARLWSVETSPALYSRIACAYSTNDAWVRGV